MRHSLLQLYFWKINGGIHTLKHVQTNEMPYPRVFSYFLPLWSKFSPQLLRYKTQMKSEADLGASERSVRREGTNNEKNH
jgi:hypothetical protein